RAAGRGRISGRVSMDSARRSCAAPSIEKPGKNSRRAMITLFRNAPAWRAAVASTAVPRNTPAGRTSPSANHRLLCCTTVPCYWFSGAFNPMAPASVTSSYASRASHDHSLTTVAQNRFLDFAVTEPLVSASSLMIDYLDSHVVYENSKYYVGYDGVVL